MALEQTPPSGPGIPLAEVDLRLVHDGWTQVPSSTPSDGQAGRVHVRADHRPARPDDAVSPGYLDHHPGRLSAVEVGPLSVRLAVDRQRSWPLFWTVEPGPAGCRRLVIADDATVVREALSDPALWAPAVSELTGSGFVSGGRTLLDDVHQVEQGSVVTISLRTGSAVVEDYGFFRYDGTDEEDPEAFEERFSTALDTTMSRAAESASGRDLVLPLSGGLDSRLLLAWLVNHGHAVGEHVRTFTYGVPGSREAEVSRSVAQAVGVPWTCVPYERGPLLEAWHSPTTGGFLTATYSLSALPHVQDWYALRTLREEGWLREGDLVLPGHTVVGNIHDGASLLGRQDVSEIEVVRAVINHHNDLQGHPELAYQDSWTGRPLRRALRLGGLDGSELSVRSVVEGYNFRERQTKYINNSVRAYEFFGLDWALPMVDSELWHAWATGGTRVTADRSYYRWLVDRHWQRAVGGTAEASPYFEVTQVSATTRSRVKNVLARTGTLAAAERGFSTWSSLHSSMAFDALMTGSSRPRTALDLLRGRKTLGFWTTAFLGDTWSRGAQLFSDLPVRGPGPGPVYR